MYEQEAREAVARGLAWIKENAEALNLDPSRINPDRINVVNNHDCVLASAGGRPFEDVMSDAGNPDDSDGFGWISSHGYGTAWASDPDVMERRTVALCNEWRRVLLAERQGV